MDTIKIILTPELKINFIENESGFDYISETSENLQNQIQNFTINDFELSFNILNPDIWEPGDSIVIKNIFYQNNSTDFDQAINTKLQLEARDDIYIYDSESSFLTSIIFESNISDKIFYNDDNIATIITPAVK